MLEELSLSTNRGSQLFQQRQKRMQRFVFEHPSGYRKVCARLRVGWCPHLLQPLQGMARWAGCAVCSNIPLTARGWQRSPEPRPPLLAGPRASWLTWH